MRCGGYTLLFLLVACDSPVVQPGSGGSGTEGSVPSGGTSSTTTSGDSSGETGDSSTSTTTSSGGETDPGVDTCAFLCEEPSYGDCDLFAQDCPLGEKCVPYANDGGSSWNAWRCVPLDPAPAGIGEPCTVDGPSASGIDDCGVGAMCWDVDPRTEIGTCVPHCIGSVAEPTGATTGGWDETTGGPCGFFICDDTGTEDPIECDLWEQDCPDGEKCSPWANDGGSSWNAVRCVPIDPNPDDVDEPCTVEGSGVSGIDSCVLGAMCWDVDPRTNIGTCVPLCVGDSNAPSCADANRICVLSGDGVLILCLPSCDPLDAATCPAGDGCYPYADVFLCAPDASGDQGAAFEPCEFTNACDPGLLCASGIDNPLCEGSLNCCAPYCAVSMPSCPAPLGCTPYYPEGSAPPGYEDLGACLGP